MAEYDIHQVTRYVLVRKVPGETEMWFSDLGEFKRRDDAEAVLRTMNGVQHQPITEGDVFRFKAR